MKGTLSLTLIVKNEEMHLDSVLKNAHIFADEIIIVDTGSTDSTKEIAKKYTDKIFDFKWINDFSKARNHAIEQCTCDYFMWLDADDYIEEEDAKKLNKLKDNIFECDFYFLPYYCSKDSDNAPSMKLIRERIFKNSPEFRFAYPIHEAIFYPANSRHATLEDINIYHKKIYYPEGYINRNLEICQDALKRPEYASDPRMWWVYGRELATLHTRYQDAVEAYKNALKFSDSNIIFKGYLYCSIGECLTLLKEHDEAIIYLELASDMVKDWREPLYKLYETYAVLKLFGNAIEVLEEMKAIKMPPHHEIPDPKIYDNKLVDKLISNLKNQPLPDENEKDCAQGYFVKQ